MRDGSTKERYRSEYKIETVDKRYKIELDDSQLEILT